MINYCDYIIRTPIIAASYCSSSLARKVSESEVLAERLERMLLRGWRQIESPFYRAVRNRE